MATGRIKAIVATGALALGLVASGTYVANAQPASGSDRVAAAACKTKVYFVYNKPNKGVSITKGNLKLRKLYSNCTRKTLGSWRAGSGTVKNSCTKNKGWLPNGTYPNKAAGSPYTNIKYYSNHTGVIKGKAWYVGNHKCSNGTVRTELFVHTKTPWPGTSGYYSNGCIKVTPTVANKIASLQSKYGKPTKLYVES